MHPTALVRRALRGRWVPSRSTSSDGAVLLPRRAFTGGPSGAAAWSLLFAGGLVQAGCGGEAPLGPPVNASALVRSDSPALAGPGAEESTPTPGPRVKIMTFNIRVGSAADGDNAWDKRRSLVYQVFTDQDADFVGLQEALHFQLTEIDAAVRGYRRIGVGTEDGRSRGPFNAIYYREARFSLNQSNTFWLSDTPGVPGSQTWGNKFPRAVTWGRFIEKDSGYALYVYNTHFDHVSQGSREKSAVLLAQRIAARAVTDDPFVVTGDFNSAEGNLATRFLKGLVKIDGESNDVPMRDTFRVLHPDADRVGTAHGFDGGTGGNKIDYIYVPPKQQVQTALIDHFNVAGRYPSDHFPVVATVKLAASE